MSWMICLMQQDKLGRGCRECKFLNDLKEKAQCIVDERVDVYNDGKIREHRPYSCPFRYYDDKVEPVIKKFAGMTCEQTVDWFNGADCQARKYVNLEVDRDKYISHNTNVQGE